MTITSRNRGSGRIPTWPARPVTVSASSCALVAAADPHVTGTRTVRGDGSSRGSRPRASRRPRNRRCSASARSAAGRRARASGAAAARRRAASAGAAHEGCSRRGSRRSWPASSCSPSARRRSSPSSRRAAVGASGDRGSRRWRACRRPVTRAAAPALWALVDDVAVALETRAPAPLVDDGGATCRRARRRREPVLVLGCRRRHARAAGAGRGYRAAPRTPWPRSAARRAVAARRRAQPLARASPGRRSVPWANRRRGPPPFALPGPAPGRYRADALAARTAAPPAFRLPTCATWPWRRARRRPRRGGAQPGGAAFAALRAWSSARPARDSSGSTGSSHSGVAPRRRRAADRRRSSSCGSAEAPGRSRARRGPRGQSSTATWSRSSRRPAHAARGRPAAPSRGRGYRGPRANRRTDVRRCRQSRRRLAADRRPSRLSARGASSSPSPTPSPRACSGDGHLLAEAADRRRQEPRLPRPGGVRGAHRGGLDVHEVAAGPAAHERPAAGARRPPGSRSSRRS